MPKLVWFNGVITPLEQATVPAADHAHLYGDGLFEGIRFYSRRIYRLDEHLRRLYHGINYMGFSMGLPYETLRSTVLDVCRQSDLNEGYIRLNVTRGTGLGLDPKNMEEKANVMIMISSLSLFSESLYEVGIKVVTSPIRVIPADSLDPRVKCIGRYASNILAKQHANRVGAGEALLLNHQGFVAEGTGINVFMVSNGVVRTPHSSCGILEGCTRNAVIDLLKRSGCTVEETFLTTYDFYSADEAFFTGTAAEVMPFTYLDGNPIGNGKVGEITKRAMALFAADTANGVPFDLRVNEAV